MGAGFGATASAILGGSQRAKAAGYRPNLITMSIFMGTIPGLAKMGGREYGGLLQGFEGWTGVDQFDEANPHFMAMLDRFAARFDGRRPLHCYSAQGYDMGNVIAHGLARQSRCAMKACAPHSSGFDVFPRPLDTRAT